MIISNGSLKLRNVYDVKLADKVIVNPGKADSVDIYANNLTRFERHFFERGTTNKVHQVQKIMYNGHQIWPDAKRMVARVTLEPEGFLGEKRFAVWRTVRELYLRRFNDPERCFIYIKDPIDGYTYVFDQQNAEVENGVVVKYYYVKGGADQIDFYWSDIKPPAEKIKVGDSLMLRALIAPMTREEAVGGGEGDGFSFRNFDVFNTRMFGHDFAEGNNHVTREFFWDLPPWEGVVVHSQMDKPKKKMRMEGNFEVFAQPSNELCAKLSENVGGEKRGSYYIDKALPFVPGAKSMRVLGNKHSDAINMQAWLTLNPVNALFYVKVAKVETVDVYE